MPAPTPLPKDLLSRPFTRAEAAALGVSDRVLAGQRFRHPHRGIYVPSHLQDTVLLRATAASLALPRAAAFSHTTAAELRRLPVPESSALHACVPVGEVVPDIAGVIGHEGLLEEHVTLLGALRVVTGCRTFLDLAPELGLTDLVILGDAVARREGKDALLAVVREGHRRRGVVGARRALEMVEEGVDSPMETRVRLLIVFGGLPCPRVNRDVVVDGQRLARPDLSYPQFKIAIEYDGETHRLDKKQWRDDIFRKEGLEDFGWRCMVLTADDVFVRARLTEHRVRGALLDRGWRP